MKTLSREGELTRENGRFWSRKKIAHRFPSYSRLSSNDYKNPLTISFCKTYKTLKMLFRTVTKRNMFIYLLLIYKTQLKGYDTYTRKNIFPGGTKLR